MKTLTLEATEDTPFVRLDSETGILEISGRSLPEDIFEFYTPIYNWIDSYMDEPLEKTLLQVKVDYFNSSSQRALNEIFVSLSRIKLKGKEIIIEWYYIEGDDEIREIGEEFEELCGLAFGYISYNPE